MYMKVTNALGYFKNPYCKCNTDPASETLKATKTAHVFDRQMHESCPPLGRHPLNRRTRYVQQQGETRTAERFLNRRKTIRTKPRSTALPIVSKFLIALEQLKVFLNR